jgi:minor extracellular serine protease Vpr
MPPNSGYPASLTTLSPTLTTPQVIIGGIPVVATFSGLAPGYVGLYQVNAQVPAGIAASNQVPLSLSIGNVASNTVTIAVQ